MLTGEILNTKYRATKFIAMFNTGYEKNVFRYMKVFMKHWNFTQEMSNYNY